MHEVCGAAIRIGNPLVRMQSEKEGRKGYAKTVRAGRGPRQYSRTELGCFEHEGLELAVRHFLVHVPDGQSVCGYEVERVLQLALLLRLRGFPLRFVLLAHVRQGLFLLLLLRGG